MLSSLRLGRATGYLAPLALVALLAGPVRAQLFDVTELVSLGGTTTKAFAINSSGVIVGTSTSGGPGRAVRWTNLAIEELGNLGGTLSEAYAVNTSGAIVGYATDASGHPRAFLWNGAGMQDLGTLGGVGSIARGIDDQGDVVGNADLATSSVTHAFVRHTDGIMDDLGAFPGADNSYACAVNDSGRVVGWSQTSAGKTHAFMLFPRYGLVDLNTLGGSNSYAYALIPGVGYVMAGSGQTPGNVQQLACVWDEQAHVRPLGTLGGSFGECYSISPGHEVVGASTTDLGDLHAFYWPGSGALQDLNDLVSPDSGWVLVEARGITSGGRIVGWGYRNGKVRAFLLSPRNVGAVGSPRGGSVSFRGPSSNPMSHKTNLEFDLPASGPARIDLYDAQGRLVWASEGAFGAGPNAIRWDGQDNTGRPVKSGFYWARLRAAGQVLTRAVTVIR